MNDLPIRAVNLTPLELLLLARMADLQRTVDLLTNSLRTHHAFVLPSLHDDAHDWREKAQALERRWQRWLADAESALEQTRVAMQQSLLVRDHVFRLARAAG